jgi:hypothetical protein
MTLSANDIRAVGSWHHHDCSAGWGNCYVPDLSRAQIEAQRDRRQEERRRRREAQRKRQEEDLRKRREEFSRQVEACRKELARRSKEEARRREEERSRQAEEKAEAKRVADGQVLAEKIGTQAAALAATPASFKQYWNECPTIQKQQAQMRRSLETLYNPKTMGQVVIQERIGLPTSEALEAIDIDHTDEDPFVVDAPLSLAVPLKAASKAIKQPESIVLEAHAEKEQVPIAPDQKSDLRTPARLPVVVEDVTDAEKDEQAQSETGSAVASVDIDEEFASACASIETSSDPDVNVTSVWSNDPLFHIELDWDLAKDTQASSTLAGAPTPQINAEQAVPGEPEDTLGQVGPWETADTQPQVAQSSQPLTTPTLPTSPFNPLKTLRQVAKAITIPFDNQPLAPLTRAVHTVIIQLKQCPLCTTQLQAPIQRGEKVMRLLEQQRHTPTLDFNERVLRQTLEEKLSCHVRFYQCLHLWSQGFTDEDRQAFEAVIMPIIKQQFLCANTTVQQEMLAYWENGGHCYTDLLQSVAVEDWLSQSLLLDLAQEALVRNDTLLHDQIHASRLSSGTTPTRRHADQTFEPAAVVATFQKTNTPA